MPPALWTLIRLHFKSVLRRTVRGVRRPRGFVFLLFGLLVFCMYIIPSIYGATKIHRTDPQTVRTVAPFAILGFCLGNLFVSFGESAVAFTAAEVDFLFPGPFSRRSLLAFKMIKTALGTTSTALIFSLVMLRFSSHWIACFIGIWLTIQFMQLFAMAVVMLGQTLGERAYTAVRRTAVLIILAVVLLLAAPKLAAGLNTDPMQLMRQVHSTLLGHVLLWPFDVFAKTITAQNIFPELIQSALIALTIDLLMLAAVISLDANYMETAAALSLRRYERFNRIRRGGVAGMTGRANTRLHVKPLPFLGGAGPIAWRQLTGAVRNSRGLFILLSISCTIAAVFLMRHHSKANSDFGSIAGVAIWINLIFVSMLKFDFRDELDRLDLLRSLPITPTAIAAAEVAVPTLLLCAIQSLLLVAAAVEHLAPLPLLFAAAAFSLPFNLLLVSIENLMFLLFPLRSVGLIAGDMQMVGRQMIIFFCKFLLLMTGLSLAALLALPAYILSQKSWPAFTAVMWLALLIISLSMIPLLAHRFSRFDPSLDTPA
jgi:hypothetical protein